MKKTFRFNDSFTLDKSFIIPKGDTTFAGDLVIKEYKGDNKYSCDFIASVEGTDMQDCVNAFESKLANAFSGFLMPTDSNSQDWRLYEIDENGNEKEVDCNFTPQYDNWVPF